MKIDDFNKNKSIFSQNLGKVMLVVTMATDVAIKIFTKIFLVLSGNDQSVKVSSNSEVGSGTALWEFFGPLRELVLIPKREINKYYK